MKDAKRFQTLQAEFVTALDVMERLRAYAGDERPEYAPLLCAFRTARQRAFDLADEYTTALEDS